MTWKLRQTPRLVRALQKIDRPVQRRVLIALYEISELDDPTVRLKPLRHDLAGLWRLRVGDFRVILDVRQHEVLIVALDLGHGSDIYD